jgi:hypothetical protein
LQIKNECSLEGTRKYKRVVGVPLEKSTIGLTDVNSARVRRHPNGISQDQKSGFEDEK